MATTAVSAASGKQIEDVLAHLPITATTQYRKGQSIYSAVRDPTNLYLVVAGSVGISRITEDNSEVLFSVARPDDVFGESAFLGNSGCGEQATALQPTKLMAWPVSDLEDLVLKRPPLAVALLQLLAQRNAELMFRIQSFAIDRVERRLARSLLYLSDRLGVSGADGSVRLMPFTHTQLSRYIGTSREVITQYMNRFRKQGFVTYSRSGIVLHGGGLRTVLATPKVEVSRRSTSDRNCLQI